MSASDTTDFMRREAYSTVAVRASALCYHCAMKKRTASILVLFVAVCGVFLWQYISFRSMRGQLEEVTAAIAEEYIAIVNEDVLAIESAHDLSAAQTRLVKHLKEASLNLEQEDMSLESTTQAISDLQRTLARFSTSVSTSSDIASDPSFSHLQTQIGERGEVRELLSDYNAIAVRWNRGIQSELGSVLGRFDGSDRSILPYLRFDGEQEFVPVISL